MTSRTETQPVAHLPRARRTPLWLALFAADRWRWCGTVLRILAAALFVVLAASQR